MTNRRTPGRIRHGGRYEAAQLYDALAHGQPPPTVLAPDFTGGPVHMDVPFTYSRYFAMDIAYQPGGMVAVGPPGVVAGAAIGHLIGSAVGYARAASLARPQWRGHQPARVAVTTTSTWCAVAGRWLCFDHHAVVDYQLSGDSCILTFEQTAPLRLDGPSAWCHAVLYAYLRHGPAWQTAPLLHPLRNAADGA
jgi:hypothetical protein